MSSAESRLGCVLRHLRPDSKASPSISEPAGTVSAANTRMIRSPITTHCLDTAVGRPARNLLISLEYCESIDSSSGFGFTELGRGRTNDDGRVGDLLEGPLRAGFYRMTFHTAEYFAALATKSFYPLVQIHFEITSPNEHYHVPLLLSPYGYSTYRGS
mmetsp:Transcript_18092/g.31223  ORF Transcript_18092/g.31223 Transcript_18092/m.31223 type:complete len:158 (-) Transcript_18092:95-568(-)